MSKKISKIPSEAVKREEKAKKKFFTIGIAPTLLTLVIEAIYKTTGITIPGNIVLSYADLFIVLTVSILFGILYILFFIAHPSGRAAEMLGIKMENDEFKGERVYGGTIIHCILIAIFILSLLTILGV
jgi:hypothetical protein